MALTNKSVVVTGAAHGIGRAYSERLAADGAAVALLDIDAKRNQEVADAICKNGGKAVAFEADVRDFASFRSAVDQAAKAFGTLTGIVNNAGMLNVVPITRCNFEDIPDTEWDESFRLNTKSAWYGCKAALPYMRMSGGGRIVNISSIGGRLGVPHLAAYCASKFALTGLSQSVRAEFARENILITTVYPGLMRTGSIFNAWFKGQHRSEFTWFAIAGSMPVITMDAERAASRIVNAAEHGDPELVVGWPAKLAAAAAGVVPGLTAAATGIANRFLPQPSDDVEGEESHSGWQSASDWAPSTLTRLSERAAARNNELP